MSLKTILIIGAISLAMTLSVSSAAVIQPVKDNELGEILTGIKSHYEKINSRLSLKLSRSNWDKFWDRVSLYAAAKDLTGLIAFLRELPETQMVLDWLRHHFPQVYLALCPLFDACQDDVVIDPIIMQKIMRYILANDWEGLVTYLKSLPEFELLCVWIKENLPNAWNHICELLERPC